jgi:hypothetical protein
MFPRSQEAIMFPKSQEATEFLGLQADYKDVQSAAASEDSTREEDNIVGEPCTTF